MTLGQRISDRLGPLQERPFRLLWVGQGASAIGDSLVPVAVAFAVLGIAGSPTALGLVMASFTLPRVLLILVGGVWADRMPRQLVMVGADVIRGVVEVGFAILLLSGHAQLWELAAGAAVIGAASAFFMPASTGLIPQTVTAPRLQQANALMSLSRSATSIVGPSVSGLLVASIGPGWVFAVDAATFAVSAISLSVLRLERAAQPAERQSFLAELAGGWREVASRSWLLASILTFGFSNVAIGPVFILGPVIARDHLGGAASWGLIVTGLGVGGLIGGLIALRWRPERPLSTAFTLGVAFSFPMLALAPPAPLPIIVAAVLLSAMVVELSNAWWYTVLQQQVPAQALSRVSAYDWLASIIFQPIGFAIVGPIAAVVSAPVTLIGAAVLSLTSNLAAASIPAIRGLRWKNESSSSSPPADTPMAGRLEIDRPVSAPRDQLPQ